MADIGARFEFPTVKGAHRIEGASRIDRVASVEKFRPSVDRDVSFARIDCALGARTDVEPSLARGEQGASRIDCALGARTDVEPSLVRGEHGASRIDCALGARADVGPSLVRGEQGASRIDCALPLAQGPPGASRLDRAVSVVEKDRSRVDREVSCFKGAARVDCGGPVEGRFSPISSIRFAIRYSAFSSASISSITSRLNFTSKALRSASLIAPPSSGAFFAVSDLQRV